MSDKIIKKCKANKPLKADVPDTSIRSVMKNKIFLLIVVFNLFNDCLVSAQVPANDACTTAIDISTNPFNDDGDTTQATPDVTPFPCAFGDNDIGVWYKYSGNNTFVEVTVNANYDVRVLYFINSCDNLICYDGLTSDTSSNTARFVADAGQVYSILVIGASGTNGTFTIEFEVMERPANDDCETATELTTLPFSILADTNGALTDVRNSECSVGPSYRGVWYKYTPTNDSITNLQTRNGNFDHRLTIYQGESCDLRSCLVSDITYTNIDYTFSTYKGTQYFFLLTGYDGGDDVGTTTFSVTKNDSPLNDNCDTATTINRLPFTDGAETIGAFIEDVRSAECGVDPSYRGVWYKYTSTIDQNITLNTFNGNFNHRIAIYEGESCDLRSCLVEGIAYANIDYTFLASKETQYFFLLTSYDSFYNAGSVTLMVTSDEQESLPPVETTNPSPTESPPELPPTESPLVRPQAPELPPTESPLIQPQAPELPPTRTPSMSSGDGRPTGNPVSPPTETPVLPPTTRPINVPTETPTTRPMNMPSETPTKQPVFINMPSSPPTNQPTTVPTVDPPQMNTEPVRATLPPVLEMPTCPDGSPGPIFPDECVVDCPRDQSMRIAGCVTFCDVRPIFGCMPVCSRTVTAIVPGGCRERCCLDSTTTPNTDPPTTSPNIFVIPALGEGDDDDDDSSNDDDVDDDATNSPTTDPMFGRGKGRMHHYNMYHGKGKGMNYYFYNDGDESSDNEPVRRWNPTGWNERRRMYYQGGF